MTSQKKSLLFTSETCYKRKGGFGHEGRRTGSVCQPEFLFINTLIPTPKTKNKLIKAVAPFELPVVLVAFPTGQFLKAKD